MKTKPQKLADKFTAELAAAAQKAEAYRAGNAALAKNYVDRARTNLIRDLRAREVKRNGCLTFLQFPDHSQLRVP